jgi:hypothetical protein
MDHFLAWEVSLGSVLVVLVFLLACRQPLCWYFKINTREKLLRDLLEELKNRPCPRAVPSVPCAQDEQDEFEERQRIIEEMLNDLPAPGR